MKTKLTLRLLRDEMKANVLARSVSELNRSAEDAEEGLLRSLRDEMKANVLARSNNTGKTPDATQLLCSDIQANVESRAETRAKAWSTEFGRGEVKLGFSMKCPFHKKLRPVKKPTLTS